MTPPRAAVVPLLLAGLCGCATVFSREPTRQVELRSQPEGAAVVVIDADGREVARGVTPLVVDLDVSTGYFDAAMYHVHYALECHDEASLVIGSRVDPWYFGNLLFPGALGYVLIDPLSGAMWELDERAEARMLPRSDPACVDVAAPPPNAVPEARSDQASPNTSP